MAVAYVARTASDDGRAPRRPRLTLVEPPWVCDGLSFAEVYDQHADAVHAIAERFGPPGAAADIAQETFLRLWRAPGRFDPARCSLRGYLVMATRNLAIDHLRSEVSRHLREERSRSTAPPSGGEQLAALLCAEATDELTVALGRLSAECRDAIVTAFYGGMTYTDVALAFGACEGTIKSRIRRGLLQLRRELQALDPEHYAG